ncbi:MAG: hypothetical protein PVI90_20030 [Desulfobacteraceae bacterium]
MQFLTGTNQNFGNEWIKYYPGTTLRTDSIVIPPARPKPETRVPVASSSSIAMVLLNFINGA